MTVVGVDGCRSGWVAVWNTGSGYDWMTYPTVEALWKAHRRAQAIWIDMPIGLPEGQARATDRHARVALGHRRNSVFSVPTRAAVYAADHRAACDANFERTGKKISIQAWCITPKIRELDHLLQHDPDARQIVGESHPEVVFWALSGAPMMHNKKTRAGRAERLAVLERWLPDGDALLTEGRARMTAADARSTGARCL
jgi:predicted RNase H-like nuclease